ncbi:MAG: HEAT repeat domain-containing protein [Gammaproteobacteria bacterium]|nr:HEAT repeat domain-containing protein [Gammaproteobacteria bacterium]
MVSKFPEFRALFLILLLLPCFATKAASFKISVTGDTVTAKIDAAPLVEVLAEIKRQTKITIELDDTVSAHPIWADFKDLPLETGIRKLLRGHSFSVFYAGPATSIDTHARPQVVKISVEAGGDAYLEGQSLPPLNHTPPTNSQLSPAANTNHRDPEAPTLAHNLDRLWATVDQDATRAKESLSKAIQDPEPSVRETALEVMASMDQSFVGELLAEMALKDPEPEIRIEALNLLAEVGQHNALNTALSLAVQDPDSKVQAVAAELIELLH